MPDKPLLRRFGAGFFKGVPSKPGVYIMGGEVDRVLYIGQSGNLRHRLATYKNACADRTPRKVIRLLHSVRTIVWEECETAEAARLKENQLLRIHRPRFNVQNTYPRAYQFIALHGEMPHASRLCVAGAVCQLEVQNLWRIQERLCPRGWLSLRLIWAWSSIATGFYTTIIRLFCWVARRRPGNTLSASSHNAFRMAYAGSMDGTFWRSFCPANQMD